MAKDGLKHITKNLGRLLEDLEHSATKLMEDINISAITSDSRQVKPGTLFVAVPGLTVNGHNFVDDAIAKGCAAVMVEKGWSKVGNYQNQDAPCIEVTDTRAALGRVAASFYGHPARAMKLIGITGTNGKTTTTYLLEAMIREAGGNPGVIGTVNYRYNGLEVPASFTTPEAVSLHELLRRMADSGISHVIMEVSSHALAQKRLEGLLFDIAVFTNLSRDHLDFHGDMAGYFASKKKLFLEYLKKDGKAVVVESSELADSVENVGPRIDWGSCLVEEIVCSAEWQNASEGKMDIITCGMTGAKVWVDSFNEDLNGIDAEIVMPAGRFHLHSSLVGEFNLKNLLGGVGAGIALGFDPNMIVHGLGKANIAPGRLERVMAGKDPAVFVDYAHTPDALENVLKTLRKIVSGRLIVVFGCGGDRDQGKRPLMGEIAGRLADIALATSDNPRGESPLKILAEIELGLQKTALRRMRAEALLNRPKMRGYDIIESRREAIAVAVRYANPGDLVLISGKGHENYQITSTGKIFFDDRLEAVRQLAIIKW